MREDGVGRQRRRLVGGVEHPCDDGGVRLALDVQFAAAAIGHGRATAPVRPVADLLQHRDRAGPEPVEHARPVVGLGDGQDHAGLQRLQAR